MDPQELDEDFVKLGHGLKFLAECIFEFNEFATELAKGNFNAPTPPSKNMLAGPLKSLQANFKHITWQSQQVSQGDYSQKLDFMGEFSTAFNSMVEQLAGRQRKLEDEIKSEQKIAKALEMNNQILSNIAQYVPHMVFVYDSQDEEILLANNMAQEEIRQNPAFLADVLAFLPHRDHNVESLKYSEVTIAKGRTERHFSVIHYELAWEGHMAETFVISDITAEKTLEIQAFSDGMTNLHNRNYGMNVLNNWIDQKIRFVLIFFDLDNLKFVNDTYGHSEGDRYIITVANQLKNVAPGSVASRIGGDEFMLLIPGVGFETAFNYVKAILDAIQGDAHLSHKSFTYHASYGIVAIDEKNTLSGSQVLELADERMYENKRERKKKEQNND